MTVIPSSCDVADKAVSTDDGGGGCGGMEVARLEAVLAALVETKVEAMKASSVGSNKRFGSAPASPRRLRLTSTSTASSSQNHHHRDHHHREHHDHQHRDHHQHHHQHHHHHHHRDHDHENDRGKRKGHHQRRHDSAPCGEFIEDTTSHQQFKRHHGKGGRRASESPRSPQKKRRHSKSPHTLQDVVKDVHMGLDSRFELLGLDADQDLTLINFERARETFNYSCDYPRLHRSACYFPQNSAQLKIHYDEDDYVALNVADELEEETLSGLPDKVEDTRERYHRPRRKRKRRQRKVVELEGTEVELADPEELPPRARWTIVATAFLLLAMSLLLVGVTLRMAPIIDEMGDGRRASVCKKGKARRASTTRRKDSVRPTKGDLKIEPVILKTPREIAQARRHRRIAMAVLGTFLFLLIASVLVVVVTLTHSSFHRLPMGSKELAEHRAQLRKENEELMNLLNRDSSVVENATLVPP